MLKRCKEVIALLTETIVTGLNDLAGAAFYVFLAVSVCYTVGSIIKNYFSRGKTPQ